MAATLQHEAATLSFRIQTASTRKHHPLEGKADDALTFKLDQSTGAGHLATRARIKEGTLLRLAKFATKNVLQRLKDRSDLGPDLHAELETAVTERVNEKMDLPEPAPVREKVSPEQDTLEKIKEMHGAGKLTEREVLKAIESDNRLFADAALAVLTDQSIGRVREVLRMKSAKSILALTWRAGLSMTTAVAIQEKLLRLPASKIMRAGPKGLYPISEDDLSWQAELLFD